MINQDYYSLGIEPSAIRKLYAYGLARKKELGDDKVFDFSLGNPNVAGPKQVKDVLAELIEQDHVQLHSYSMANGLPEVREKIADSIKKNYDFPANQDHVFLTSGAAGAIVSTLKAVVNSDEELILISPYFPEYKMWTDSVPCKVAEVPAMDDDFQLDIPAIKNALNNKTAAIIINSPNNPTGVVYSKENLQVLAVVLNQAQKEFDRPIYIIADEPYRKIVYEAEIPFIPSIYNNTIICDSASKSLSMPGERIGHIFVSSTADNADELIYTIAGAARALGHVCAPVLFQRLYGKCFDLPADIDVYRKNRDLITNKLSELGFEFVQPDGAFYLWMKSPLPDAKEFSELAKKHEILIVPSDTFGCTGWVRLGYCVSTETITNSFSAFEALSKEVISN